ncbi:MAG: ribonuclease Z [Moraxella sp.]|nr:ribonuclease Z [Moraxella sp.]
MFNLTFLGTSSGVPTHERNTSALAIECVVNPQGKRHAWILVDCGEGTQHQLLKSHLSPNNLSAILITHTHGDHCYGLVGLLSSLSMNRRTKPLTLIAPKAISKFLEVVFDLSDTHLGYLIDFIEIEEHLGKELLFGFNDEHTLNICIHELSHRIRSYGFEITQTLSKDKLITDKLTDDGVPNRYWSSILKADSSIIINDKTINPYDYKIHIQSTTKIIVAGDNDTPSLLSHAVKDCHALIHEATYTDDVMQKIVAKPAKQGGFDPKHSSAKMVAKFAKTHKIPTLILTHFSARYALFDDENAKQPNMGHIRSEVERYYDGKLILAKDFLQVAVG